MIKDIVSSQRDSKTQLERHGKILAYHQAITGQNGAPRNGAATLGYTQLWQLMLMDGWEESTKSNMMLMVNAKSKVNKTMMLMESDGKSGPSMVKMMLGTPANGCNRMVMKRASRCNSHLVDISGRPGTVAGNTAIVSSRIMKYFTRGHLQPSGRAGGVGGRGDIMGEGMN